MTTQNTKSGGLRAAAAVGLGMAVGTLAAWAAQRRVIEALRAQVERLEQQTQVQQQANLTSQQQSHWALLSKAMDDSDLAEVLDLYDASPKKRRQFLFANALYTNLLFYYRIGNMTKDEFFKRVRGMFQNPIVREYWYATQQNRASIADTEEAELGLLVDDLLRQLEEAETEEWWVVGEPPGED
jgi:hypothetical protein